MTPIVPPVSEPYTVIPVRIIIQIATVTIITEPMNVSICPLLMLLGPGILVMVADNDAGGVITYAQTGSIFGIGFFHLTSSIISRSVFKIMSQQKFTDRKNRLKILENAYSNEFFNQISHVIIYSNSDNICSHMITCDYNINSKCNQLWYFHLFLFLDLAEFISMAPKMTDARADPSMASLS